MAEAIFDSTGNIVAWRNRNVIFDRQGNPIAFVWDQGVFRFDGRCVGWYIDGFFWGPDGRAVACIRGATGGPAPPARYEALVAPVFRPDPPTPPLERAPAPPRIRSPRWSGLGWDAFVAGAAGAGEREAARG